MEKDLTIRTAVTGAAAAKAELDSLKQSTDGITAGTAEQAAATTAATSATTAATAAATRQAAAQSTVVLALREVRSAMAALAASTAVGGDVMVAALGRVAIALGTVEVEIETVRASGGIVTPAQIAALEGYKAQLAGLAPQLAAASGATDAAAGSSRLFTSTTAAAGQAIAGKTVSLAGLTAGFLRFLGPVGLAIAAISLLPTIIKAAREKLDFLRDGFGPLEKGMKGFDETVKRFGVTMKESFTWKEALTGIDIFLNEYKNKLSVGENATRNFVELNKTSISQWMQMYEDAKVQIPLALLEIASKYDILTPQQQEFTRRLGESKKGVDDLAGSVRDLGKEMSADFTFNFMTGEQIADIRTGLLGVATATRAVVTALSEVKAAADIAFPAVYSGGHSQLGPPTGVPPVT